MTVAAGRWQRFSREQTTAQVCAHCQRTTTAPASGGWLWRDLGGGVIQALCAYCCRTQQRYEARVSPRAGR